MSAPLALAGFALLHAFADLLRLCRILGHGYWLGRMFGFEFMENFNFPYLAGSVKDFGGAGTFRFPVFQRLRLHTLWRQQAGPFQNLCESAHGFSSPVCGMAPVGIFGVGVFHGLFMLAERAGMERLLEGLWRPVQTIYTVVVVMFVRAMFRVESIGNGILYWKDLLNLNTTPLQFADFMKFVTPELLVCLFIGIFGALGGFMKFKTWHEKVMKAVAQQRCHRLFISY